MTDQRFTPTAEQQHALDLFSTGKNLAIEAGAGTGKTSTLILLANSTKRRGQYLAFNRSIVTEAGTKMPGNVQCNTAHSLAFRAVGKRYSHRLNGARVKSSQVARWLNIDPFVVTFGTQRKVLQPGYLAGLVMRSISRFCQTADETPNRSHVPYIDGIDMPSASGGRTYSNNNEIAKLLEPALTAAWADLRKIDGGRLRFSHEHYLKLWQLSRPYVDADFILFDEAQDANPVMLDVVLRQASHAQLVFVGDSQQQIYEFTGAVNALDRVRERGGETAVLSQSFRFGDEIAGVANRMLERLGAPLRIIGSPAVASVVDVTPEPDAILCRTNARSVTALLSEIAAGRRPHLIGGGREVADFARGAKSLIDTGWTSHPELACFESWAEVQEYVEIDPQGGELKLLVSLVDDFGVDVILDALDNMPAERDADVVISTAHKSKGREWGAVQIADDFPEPDDGLSDSEMRLLYVAATRARFVLDIEACAALKDDGSAEEFSETETLLDALAGGSTV